jgi:hypothetical protein
MKRILLSLALAFALVAPARAYERTSWATSPNNAITNTTTTTVAQHALWYLIEAPQCTSAAWNSSPPGAGCWSPYCSSNSVSVGACDGSHTTDNIGTTFNATNIVAASAGTAHSWSTQKITNSSQTLYMTVDYLATNSITVAFSKAAPGPVTATGTNTLNSSTITMGNTTGILVGMVVTSGTAAGSCSSCTVTAVSANTSVTLSANWTTANTSQTYVFSSGVKSRPTATDEWTITSFQHSTGSVATQNRVHFSLSSEGDFWFCNTRDSTNVMCDGSGNSPLVVEFLKDTKSGDAQIAVASIAAPQGATSAAGTVASGSWMDGATGTGVGFKGRDSTNATNYHFAGAVPLLANGGSALTIFGTGATTTFQGTGDVADSKQDDYPIYLFSWQVGQVTLKGRLVDMSWAPVVNSEGTCAPASSPYTSVLLGKGAWVPWNASVTPSL